MQIRSARLFIVLLGTIIPAFSAPVPMPEPSQAVEATRLINQFHDPRPPQPPKKLHVVYFTPSDREPAERYEQRLDAILEDIRGFYSHEMERLGFGKKTFKLDRDERGKLIIHLVKGKEPASAFLGWEGRNGGNTGSLESGPMVKRECEPVLKAAGISFEQETILIFCHLATYDAAAGTFRHRSPYYGSWTQEGGLCFAADWANQDLDNLTRNEPKLNDAEYGKLSLGKHTTIFIGGIAHELGHAFGLPHCGECWDEKSLGTSLMGGGNHTYREELRHEGKGSFLTMATAMRLASRPLFNSSDKGMIAPGRLTRCDLILSTNLTQTGLSTRKGKLRVEGVVTGSPSIYGVVAYFDSARDGGYRAPTATSVPDQEGRFAIEVSDLKPSAAGELRIEFCHANSAVSERRFGFSVTPDGQVDLSEWEIRRALEPIADAVAHAKPDDAQAALQKLDQASVPALARVVAKNLVASLDPNTKATPAEAPISMIELPLGDARAEVADVGWLKPAANRIPNTSEIPYPFLDSGKIYATGLYAHSPSRYVFDLGGKWKQLKGEAGLHTFHQPYGSVIFTIRIDDHELYRSPVIRGSSKAKYDLNLTGAKKLELTVEKSGASNGGNWGLWLDPILTR